MDFSLVLAWYMVGVSIMGIVSSLCVIIFKLNWWPLYVAVLWPIVVPIYLIVTINWLISKHK